jgi:hydrogenase maturation protease
MPMRGDGSSMPCRLLVIGYGNSLRSDDGAGVRVAEAVGRWGHPDIRSLAVPQLTPEIADGLAVAESVVFVDARVAEEGSDIEIEAIEPATSVGGVGHVSDPRSLLALTRWLHGRSPRAHLLTVPGVEFALGEEMSTTALRGIVGALDWIALTLT